MQTTAKNPAPRLTIAQVLDLFRKQRGTSRNNGDAEIEALLTRFLEHLIHVGKNTPGEHHLAIEEMARKRIDHESISSLHRVLVPKEASAGTAASSQPLLRTVAPGPQTVTIVLTAHIVSTEGAQAKA